MTSTLAAAIAVAFAAGLLRGFAGVGSGMLMAPIFAVLYGPLQTVAIITLMEIAVTVQLLPGTWRHMDWRLIGVMGVAATAFMPLGTALLLGLDPELLARAIAGIVFVFALILLTGWRYDGPRPAPVTLGVGAVSGVLMAATSIGNPPVILYLLSGNDSAQKNRANFNGYFAVTILALVTWMLARGLIGLEAARTAGILLPAFLAAAWIGSRLFDKSSETLYRRLALGLLICVGVYGVLR